MSSVSPRLEAVTPQLQADGVPPEPLLEPVCVGFADMKTPRGRLLSALYRDLWDTATKPDSGIMDDTSVRRVDELHDRLAAASAVSIVRKALCIEQIAVLSVLGGSELLRQKQPSSNSPERGPDLALGFRSALAQIMEMQGINNRDITDHVRRIVRAKKAGAGPTVHHTARPVGPDSLEG